MAMRRPISRVRSVTLTSMMFMMPMPPTSSETAAMAASSSVSAPVAAVRVPAMSARFRMLKSSSVPSSNVMAVAQQSRHLGLRALGMILGIGADHDGAVDVFLKAALDFGLIGGLGNKHHVVVILALHRLALGFEHADHLRRARC